MDYQHLSEDEILKRIGAKLKELRLDSGTKQKDLAEASGLSLFSISQIETGHNTSLLSLIQILKALGKMELLDAFFKPREVDPELLARFIESQQSQRKRVSSSRTKIIPYFQDDDDEGQPLGLVADDSEPEK